jgi:hypothetical protein
VSSSNVVIAVSNALSSSLVAYQTSVTNTSGLGSYYPFDQLTANDALGQHQGTLQGTAYFTAGLAGGPDQALLLDGAGFVGLGAVPDFDFASGVGSVEAWVRADWTDIGYNPCLIADRNESAVNWSIHMNADKKAIGVWNGTAYTILAIPDAGTAWHHMAVVFDTGNYTLYWDGMLVGSVPQPLGGAAATIQFGSSLVNAAAEGWVGALDEIALYSVALSAGSVQAHYAALIGASAPVITVQPVGGAFYPGVPFQLQVGATGAGLGYQWYKNGSAIGGETNWFLTFAGLTVQDSGSYYAQVSNTGGSVKSATVSVQVGNNLAGYHAAVVQEPSLISYYTFDQSDAVDSKGTNNGTLVGSPTFTAGVGQGTDQAILLDGTGDVDLGAVPAFEFTNGVGTVEAWIRPDWTSDPGYDPCIVADRNGGPTDWSIHMVRTRAAIGNWNGSHFQSSGVANTTGWHHYAVVFGAGQVSMYWDGDLLGSFAQAINLGSGLTAQIGSSASGSTVEGWIGALDEVAFYSASLSGTAIHNHFLSMIGAASAPKLLFSQANNQLTLSWPAGGAFTLEYADTLPAVSWTAVPGLTTNQAVLPLTNSHRFFRLRQ